MKELNEISNSKTSDEISIKSPKRKNIPPSPKTNNLIITIILFIIFIIILLSITFICIYFFILKKNRNIQIYKNYYYNNTNNYSEKNSTINNINNGSEVLNDNIDYNITENNNNSNIIDYMTDDINHNISFNKSELEYEIIKNEDLYISGKYNERGYYLLNNNNSIFYIISIGQKPNPCYYILFDNIIINGDTVVIFLKEKMALLQNCIENILYPKIIIKFNRIPEKIYFLNSETGEYFNPISIENI